MPEKSTMKDLGYAPGPDTVRIAPLIVRKGALALQNRPRAV